MKTYFAFLRAINVGGHNTLSMDELVKGMTDEGFQNVRSYIQSGNLIFHCDMKENSDVNRKIKTIITHHFSLQIDLAVRSQAEIEKLVSKCPFEASEETDVYATILFSKPDQFLFPALVDKFPQVEDYNVGEGVIYIRVPTHTYGKSVYSNNAFEKALKVRGTTRKISVLQEMVKLAKAK